ncbi:MAG: DUF4845 domain-containing protein [Rhodoferax sp.]|nr:DUF4845 domain-containing protein [Rhodoferax sp.]
MALHNRLRQRGIGFISLVFLVAVLGMGALVAAQTIPTLIEYFAVQKAVQKAAVSGPMPADIRASFDKAAQIDDIRSISGKDLEITKQGDKAVVAFNYTSEIHLAGPAYLTMKYQGQSK